MIRQILSKAVDARPSSHVAAGVLLAAFFALGVTSLQQKCATSDEVVHLLGGYSYWKLDDYRINPENGNLPQRWMALPLLWGDFQLPSPADLRQLDEWKAAQSFFYQVGNDPDVMLLAGRTMVALLAVLLGLVVYAWSSSLYGRGGGLLSLVLYCFSTAILGTGFLMTSDLTASLFFLLSVGSLWRLLERVTPWRVLCSAGAMGLLFVSKMSAVLVVPMGLLLIALRLATRQRLVLELGGISRDIHGWWRRSAVMIALMVVHAAAVVLVIWAFYGFRDSATSSVLGGREQLDAGWTAVLEGSFPMRRAIIAARDHHLLPESYLYGQAYVLEHSQSRWAFLNGRYSARGWWWFFPYCFLVKTSLWLFVVMGLSLSGASIFRRRRHASGNRRAESSFGRSLPGTTPLWILLGVYWAAAIFGNLNIGHRHILLTYPAVFVLCGGAVRWFERGRRSWAAWLLAGSLAGYVAEAVWVWPNYLAYFNPLAGGSAQGYRHLVDSSLDWGQDLPGLKRWLDSRGLNGTPGTTPVYLSYFGTGSPTSHGINVRRLAGYKDADLGGSRPIHDLEGGYYCVSATMLAMVLTEPRGPWSTFYERHYQQALAEFQRFRSLPEGQQAELLRTNDAELSQMLTRFDALRMGRLMAYLRHRQPDDNIGYSILIYRLSDGEAEQALDGPPVEMVAAEGPLQ